MGSPTEESDDLRRLKRVIQVTMGAKARLADVSASAAEDFYALVMGPAFVLTVTGNATRAPPVINAI